MTFKGYIYERTLSYVKFCSCPTRRSYGALLGTFHVFRRYQGQLFISSLENTSKRLFFEHESTSSGKIAQYISRSRDTVNYLFHTWSSCCHFDGFARHFSWCNCIRPRYPPPGRQQFRVLVYYVGVVILNCFVKTLIDRERTTTWNYNCNTLFRIRFGFACNSLCFDKKLRITFVSVCKCVTLPLCNCAVNKPQQFVRLNFIHRVGEISNSNWSRI